MSKTPSQPKGVKHDQGKRRFSLFPTKALYAIVDVLEYGAQKYTSPISSSPCDAYVKLAEYCTCQNSSVPRSVIQTGVTPQKGSASLVTSHSTQKQKEQAVTPTASRSEKISVAFATIESSKKQTQGTLSDNERITKTGSESTAATSKHGRSRIIANHVSELRHAVMRESDNSPQSGSLSKMSFELSTSKKVSARSARNLRSAPYLTSTTTTPPGSFVDLSADAVTKDSVSWETVSTALREHSSTCHASAVLFVRDEKLWRSGAGNWRHLENLRTRYYDAAMRHINDWWMGERNDPESGHHHLAHACCCIIFLLTVDLENPQPRRRTR